MAAGTPDVQGTRGLVLAAPASGSGKTVLTLALLRAFKERDVDVGAAKAGPDFIDPAFHALACGKVSGNLDPWAMSPERLIALASAPDCVLLIVEAMMGLFDGAADGTGSAGDLASVLGLPVVLIVDAAKQSHSIAALVSGFRDHRKDVRVAGVILNKVGSHRHETILRQALDAIKMPVLGAVYRDPALVLPERHLGLVQAGEIEDIETFIAGAAKTVDEGCDLEALAMLAKPLAQGGEKIGSIRPPGERIAIARDEAFAFLYPHLVADWRCAGAQIVFFSPLADEAPDAEADAVFLPGGYPELYAERLAAAARFKSGMVEAAGRGAFIYGECGGYMVLGKGIVDADGRRHEMCGLLDLETSFAERKLHLGYRRLTALDFPLGERFSAHEFHYTTATRKVGDPLFTSEDALGESHGPQGLRAGNVMGSYMHIIDGFVP